MFYGICYISGRPSDDLKLVSDCPQYTACFSGRPPDDLKVCLTGSIFFWGGASLAIFYVYWRRLRWSWSCDALLVWRPSNQSFAGFRPPVYVFGAFLIWRPSCPSFIQPSFWPYGALLIWWLFWHGCIGAYLAAFLTISSFACLGALLKVSLQLI